MSRTSSTHPSSFKKIEPREIYLCILVNNAGISSDTVTTEIESDQEMEENVFDVDKNNFEDWTSAYSTNVATVFFTSGNYALHLTNLNRDGAAQCVLTSPCSRIPASSAEVGRAPRGLVRHHPQHHQHQRHASGPGGPAPLRLQRLQGGHGQGIRLTRINAGVRSGIASNGNHKIQVKY